MSAKSLKVALLGASGGIGQPLALLLKLNPRIKELALYDVKQAMTPAIGVAADVSHINSPAQVKGYAGEEELGNCLTGSNIVVITAGVPRKPGMSRDDLFKINAGIVRSLATASAKYCPGAINLIITNPVNSTVPIAAEIFRKAGVYDRRKVIGVTTLDVVRSQTFIGELTGTDPRQVKVDVVGGHAGVTILPVLSKSQPQVNLNAAELENLDKRIQEAGTEVVNAKGGAGSATLSMAFAASRLVESVIRGFQGEKIVECAFVNTSDAPDAFLAGPVQFGPNGVESVLPLPALNAYEQKRLQEAKDKLAGDIKTGVDFARQQ